MLGKKRRARRNARINWRGDGTIRATQLGGTEHGHSFPDQASRDRFYNGLRTKAALERIERTGETGS